MEEQGRNLSGANEENPERGRGLRPIGEILSKLPNGPAGSSSEADRPRQTVEKVTGDCECKECGRSFPGEITVYHAPGMALLPGEHYPLVPVPRPPREYRPAYCPECQAKIDKAAAEERQKQIEEQRRLAVESWRKTCGIPEYLALKTFKNFDKSHQLDVFSDAMAWAKGFSLESPKGYPSLIFYSAEPGLGKTHLMVSIADYLFAHWKGAPGRSRSPIIFVKGPQLVRRIRYTYNLPPDDYSHEREEHIYREVTGVPLLLLDDVGKETPSKFTQETYWYIIDERVTSGLPVIITSRLPLEGDNSLEQLMGEDTVDRLYGMTRGEVTEMTGKSYRREKNIP